MKRRTRKQWYQFHLDKAVNVEKSTVYSKYSLVLDAHENICNNTKKELQNAYTHSLIFERICSFIGIETEYYRANIYPYESDVLVSVRALQDIYERRKFELKEAEKRGTQNYVEAREARKLAAEARAERVAHRKYARRIRYLEESPAIRSASRVLKQLLIKEQALDGEWINCYYCNCTIPVSGSHLEHKRPVSRGGKNNKGNLVLSCAPCNLKKGSKTDEEFFRSIKCNL